MYLKGTFPPFSHATMFRSVPILVNDSLFLINDNFRRFENRKSSIVVFALKNSYVNVVIRERRTYSTMLFSALLFILEPSMIKTLKCCTLEFKCN